MIVNIDHHIHSKYSSCCRGTYDFQDIVRALREKNLQYYCVTDHVHSDADSGGLQEHHDMLRSIPAHLLDRPVYIGVEVTFNSRNGTFSSAFMASAPAPAYIIGGGHHIPGTDVSMGSIPRAVNALQQCDDNALLELFSIYHDMQCGAVDRRTIDILAHPHDLFFRCGIFDVRQLEMFAKTVRLCREHDIAVEINSASITRCIKADSADYAPFNQHCIRPQEFYSRMTRLVLDENIRLSPASDAHTLQNVGQMDVVESFLTDSGVQEEHLFSLT